MKLRSVQVENFRAIRSLTVPLDPALTVLHGNNGHGKTSLLAAISVGLQIIPDTLKYFARTELPPPDAPELEFRPSDVRAGGTSASITLHSIEGLVWAQTSSARIPRFLEIIGQAGENQILNHRLRSLVAAASSDPQATALPVFAYYAADRSGLGIPQDPKGFRTEFNRYNAYDDALAAKTGFKTLVEWFSLTETRELRTQRDENDFKRKLPELEAVRRAITFMLGDVSEPRIDPSGRFVVTRRTPDHVDEKLALGQLSGGYRIVLAMTSDLAIRMALANPNLDDPLQSEAIVLIDEIDLHLHPEWQQRILNDLRRTFPNAQFIVSTHSPQVLTTVKPEHIVHLRATEDGIVAEQETEPTFGARAGNVLSAVMGVNERPDNAFTQLLKRYQAMIAADAGDTPDAKTLRTKLEHLSFDPQLAALDIEIARRRVMRELAAKR